MHVSGQREPCQADLAVGITLLSATVFAACSSSIFGHVNTCAALKKASWSAVGTSANRSSDTGESLKDLITAV